VTDTAAIPAQSPSPREVRRAANSEAMIAAALRLVEEKGDDFTTQDLIKEAGVALQTFYRHFGGKDQLLVAVIEAMIAGYCTTLEARGRLLDDPVARLHLYITTTLQQLDTGNPRFITSQHWRLYQIDPKAMTAATKPFSDLVQRELEAASADGTLTPRDPEHDAWMITKMVLAVFHHYAFDEAESDIETIAEGVWEFCLAAVGGQSRPSRRRVSKRRRP